MATYRERIADRLLQSQLKAAGAVLIQGPKWCGKTTTAEQHARSTLYMDNPDRMQENLLLAETASSRLLQGPTPRLIDEWQLAPKLWDAIRFEVDHREEHRGQFVLTGSAVPTDRSAMTHSGTGRFAWLTMRTMSLWESGESSGEVSLTRLFAGGEPDGSSRLEGIEELAYLVCRGGWPGMLGLDREAALMQAFNYVDALAENDISRVSGNLRNPDTVRRLLRSLARFQGSQTSLASIGHDMATDTSSSLAESTLASYARALGQMFVVEDMPAWNPNLRSKTAIRTSPTRYFVDPSIATAALGVGPEDLLADLNTLGLLFETLAVRDLRIYADALHGTVYHFRDKNGMECDAVLHLRNGRYGLVEVKLGGERLTEEGATNLLALEKKIDTARMQPPAFKMVLTGVGHYAYRRPDGVLVVPIGSLRE